MRVLIADDDQELAAALALFVEECGYESIVVTTGGLDVIQTYHRVKPDVVLMDVMMPRLNGITVSHAILSRDPAAKLILISGQLSAEHPFVTTSGATRFLQKPVQLADLKAALELSVTRPQAAA